MASSPASSRNIAGQPVALGGNGSPSRPSSDASRDESVDSAGVSAASVATVAAIGVAAYILTDLVYLASHSVASLYSGWQLVEIASSTVRKLNPQPGASEPFLLHAGGSLGNLTVFLLAWALAARTREWSATAKYFVWLTLTLNGLVAGGQVLISNAFDAGDWAMMTHGWSYRILWKLLFTAIGFGIALLAFTISREEVEIFLGRNADQRRVLLPVLSGVPYLAGGAVITATAALSVNNKLESIVVAAVWTFGLTAWLLIFALRPHLPRPRTPHRPLAIGLSLPWIAGTAILAAAFAAVLGPGIWLYS